MHNETRNGVRRFLVTGIDDELFRFHMNVAMVLNALERREQTVIYTCMAKDAEWALAVARKVGVTVEEVIGAGGHESYRLLCGDAARSWGVQTGRVADHA